MSDPIIDIRKSDWDELEAALAKANADKERLRAMVQWLMNDWCNLHDNPTKHECFDEEFPDYEKLMFDEALSEVQK